jgi:hypothetical protein
MGSHLSKVRVPYGWFRLHFSSLPVSITRARLGLLYDTGVSRLRSVGPVEVATEAGQRRAVAAHVNMVCEQDAGS